MPIFAVVAIIILFVYNPFGGDAWGTPTEGGAIGAFIVFCMALYRGMRWAQLKDALIETAKLAVMIFHNYLGRSNLCPLLSDLQIFQLRVFRLDYIA